MKKALLTAALLFFMGSAFSADKPLNVTEKVEIQAPPEKVWDHIKHFNALNTWHPAVAKTEIVEGTNDKPGAVRVLTLKDGGTIKETLLAVNDKDRNFRYNIVEGVLPVSNYESMVRVTPKGSGSQVEWKGIFKRKSKSDNPPEGEDDATAVKTIQSVYRAGLDNLKKQMEGK